MSYSVSQVSHGVGRTPTKRGPIQIVSDNDFTEDKMREILEHSGVVQQRLGILSNREDNWDNEGSRAPTLSTMDNAECTITTLLQSVINSDSSWINPFITSDFDGDITAVWRKDERELHLQIGEEDIEYFKVSGINIHEDMEVDFLKGDDYLHIWQWLITGK